MTDPTTDPTTDQLLDRVDAALERLTEVFDDLRRDDLVTRMTGARARLGRPTTIICLVGEFKAGKSSLVNALVGTDVCPVDDDLATSVITLVRYGETPGAVVRRRTEEGATAERIALDAIVEYVSEAGNPGNAKRVERVDITVPSPLLADGLAIIDTPGAGGLLAGHAAATLSFLPFADGMVFVTDSAAELTAPELEFLDDAVSRCPNVVVALAKHDITPEWRRIARIDQEHLERRGVDVPILPVSSQRHRDRLDGDGPDPGGIETLIGLLRERIVEPARATSARRIGSEVEALVGSVVDSLARRRSVLDRPESLAELEAEVAAAVERIEHLRGPGARWSTVLGDRVADLSNDTGYRFRGDIRDLLRTHEEAIETLKNGEEWDRQSVKLQDDVAAVVSRLFEAVERGRRTIRAELVELLTAEEAAFGAAHAARVRELDVTEKWRAKPLDPTKAASKAVQTGLTGLRGAQSGMMLFGMTGQFVPAAAATIFASNPILLAVGAVFGGYQLMEDRKRKVSMRRQAARTQLRQFVDDVQFEVNNDLSTLMRTLQRELRDEFTGLLTELQRTWTDSLQAAKESLSAGAAQRTAELATIDRQTETLTKLAAVVSGAVGALDRAGVEEEQR